MSNQNNNNIQIVANLLSSQIEAILVGVNAGLDINDEDRNIIGPTIEHYLIGKLIDTTLEAYHEGKAALKAIEEATQAKKIADIAEKAVKIKKANPNKPVAECYEEAANKY